MVSSKASTQPPSVVAFPAALLTSTADFCCSSSCLFNAPLPAFYDASPPDVYGAPPAVIFDALPTAVVMLIQMKLLVDKLRKEHEINKH